MPADEPSPARRMRWQAATLLIAALSLVGWGIVLLLMRWLLP